MFGVLVENVILSITLSYILNLRLGLGNSPRGQPADPTFKLNKI